MNNATIKSWINRAYYFEPGHVNTFVASSGSTSGSGGTSGGGSGGTGGLGVTVLYFSVPNSLSYPGTGNTIYDLSGNGNTATLYNGTSYVDSGNADYLYFDGTNNYVGINTTVVSNTNNVNITAWVNSDLVSQSGQIIVYVGSEQNLNGYGLSINREYVTSGNIYIRYGNSRWYNTGVGLSSNYWNHISLNINSDTTNSLYVNGVLRYSGPAATIYTPTLHTEIGRSDYTTYAYPRYLNGKVSQVLIYNGTLSSSEILSHYNSTKINY
jgi:hypothetical protein